MAMFVARLMSGIAAIALLGAVLAQQASAVADDAAGTVSEALTADIVVNGRRDRTALSEERATVGVVDIVTTVAGQEVLHNGTRGFA